MTFRGEFRTRKPTLRELLHAIRHVLSAEHAECEHLLGGEIWCEVWVKVSSHRLRTRVPVPLLKRVIHGDDLFSHTSPLLHEIDDEENKRAPPADI